MSGIAYGPCGCRKFVLYETISTIDLQFPNVCLRHGIYFERDPTDFLLKIWVDDDLRHMDAAMISQNSRIDHLDLLRP